MLRSVRAWFEGLSIQAVRQRFDKRRVQQQLDLHKLYLLTSYRSRELEGHRLNDLEVKTLCGASEKLSFESLSASVARNLRGQLLLAVHAVDDSLAASHDPVQHSRAKLHQAAVTSKAPTGSGSAPAKRQSGLAAAVGMTLTSSQALSSAHEAEVSGDIERSGQACSGSIAETLTMKAVSELVQERLGYSLDVKASAIGHRQAGDGLWLCGRAPVGSLIALYPGIVYSPAHYRRMPGYPRVDKDNDYLQGRFDGSVLDGLSWGYGALTAHDRLAASAACNRPQVLQQLRSLEKRNPLALAHFANHPPSGTQPNVVVASYDADLNKGDLQALRPYLPNVLFTDGKAAAPDSLLPMLVFVAVRELHDEEILLNYRLSNFIARPSWYSPVDEAEDKRRWA
ncbi:hypothetical protein WJX74_006373 [Apatococcus lobatus]|uniref:Uncharacterized protein n=1 Tax=Apatococcus lobatus TaxID=904363 RepID=A0AAW1QK62_9CHLO